MNLLTALRLFFAKRAARRQQQAVITRLTSADYAQAHSLPDVTYQATPIAPNDAYAAPPYLERNRK